MDQNVRLLLAIATLHARTNCIFIFNRLAYPLADIQVSIRQIPAIIDDAVV